jgi:hypothetical protein
MIFAFPDEDEGGQRFSSQSIKKYGVVYLWDFIFGFLSAYYRIRKILA